MSARCPRCGLRPEDCLCGEVVARDVATRVLVLMHARERFKSTNTGRLVSILLRGAEVRVFGDPGVPFRFEDALAPERRTLLLDPMAARRLDRALVDEDPRPRTLVLIDGTWRQAMRTLHRRCRGAVRVALPEGPPTRYGLRDPKREGRLSTLEAIARAMGVLEGPDVQAHLEAAFELFVARTRRARGR